MASNTKISVIIPVYNGEKTIALCLQSVTNQTYKNYEIVVIDNNSTDDTRKIIKKFADKDAKVKYFFENKMGRGAARNCGIKNSSGDIIAMTDSDCIVPDNWLEKICEPIINNNESIVMGSEKEAENNYWSRNIQKANSVFNESVSAGKYINHIDTKNFAIRADLIKKLLFDENLKNIEDFDLYLRVKKISKILFLRDLKVIHYHKNSLIKYLLLQIDRGYWTYKISKKYANSELDKENMFKSFSLMGNLSQILALHKKLIKNPKEFGFYIISGIAWRIGIIKGIIF